MKKGFTLIELLITIAIIVIISIVAVANFLGASHETDLVNVTQTIVASLREAETNSANQEQGSQWGVHLSNSTNTAPSYALFSGSSYNSGVIHGVYPLPSTVGFVSSTLAVASSVDIIFNPISGAVSVPKTIKLYVVSQPSLISTIIIYATGQVTSYTPSSPSAAQAIYAITAANGTGVHNSEILEFNTSGVYLSGVGCTSSVCQPYGYGDLLEQPRAVAFDATGNMWIVDNTDVAGTIIKKFDPSGIYVTAFGSYGTSNGQFGYPTGIKVDSQGNLWIVDSTNNNVQEFNSAGTYLNQIGCPSGACSAGAGSGQFSGPTSLAFDASGNIWVLDSGNNRVEEFSSSRTPLTQFTPSGAHQLNSPNGLAIDSSGNIWISDPGNNRVEEFSSSGTYLTQFGSSSNFGASCSGNGQFCGNGPNGVAIDASGNIWVADAVNYNIQEFNASGTSLSTINTFNYGDGINGYLYGIAALPAAQ